MQDAAEQQHHLDEVQDDLGVVRPDVPSLQRAQVGHAVDAAGIALLPDDQDGQDRGDGLGDDREIGAADAALEHRRADDQGEQAGHQDDGENGEGETVERLPEQRQRGDLIPVHEIGNAGGRLDLGVLDAGGFELEEHRHAVAAEAEEHALPQAQNAAIAPAQHQPDRDEGVGQIFRDQVEAEHIQRQRQDHEQDGGQHNEADELGSIEEA